jgi:carbonic anhydrase
MVTIKPAQSEEDYLLANNLIMEYVEWLGIDLSFQNFDDEIKNLKTTYGLPDGGLFIAFREEKAVGVVGVKKFSGKECELKRMYVHPDSRSFGIGQMLLIKSIELAKELKYDFIKLDTAGWMKPAINLYLRNGFKEITAYRFNPEEGTRFFELNLNQ